MPDKDQNKKKSLVSTFLALLLDEEGAVKWSTYLGGAIAAGAIILFLYTLRTPTPLQSLATSLLTAGASLAAGILIGFLFGIPRTLQRTGQRTDTASGTGGTESYGVNTNLEQISDWLTKIIVGVGLVQLTVIPGKLRALADYLATAFGAQAVPSATAQAVPGAMTQAVPSAMVIGIMCYFGIFGFLLGYLWTRIYLMSEFSRIERIARDRPEYYEGLIHAYLYQPMPAGFKNAIKAGNEYVERFGDNDRVWSYLACAYGQQRSYEDRALKPDAQKQKESRDKALEAISNALQINPDAKDFLRNLWDRNIAKAPENDLVVFFDDPAFKEKLEDGNPSAPSHDSTG